MTLTPLETTCLRAARKAPGPEGPVGKLDDLDRWLSFGLAVLMEAGRIVRRLRLLPLRESVHFKPDGSPVTRHEQEIEAFVRERLALVDAAATLVGEESGGTLPARGLALAIDPVDGTWALLGRNETCATSLVFLRDREPFLGMVSNPGTGEIGYACSGTGTRLLQLSAFGEPDAGYALPLERVTPGSLLVNLHPNRKAGKLAGALFEAWRESGLGMVRMAGGSPAWALLDAAKGSYVYLNLWTERPAAPYDLAGGVLLVRNAGGEVMRLDGTPIDVMTHEGPFVAGVDPEACRRITQIARVALRDGVD